MNTKPNKAFRWTLRGLSGLIILFFLLMFIGENFGSESSKPMTSNDILQLSVLGACMLGLGLAWKWELIGGIIALMSFVVLAIINPSVLNASLMYVLPLIAILFIVLWAIGRISPEKIRELENRP